MTPRKPKRRKAFKPLYPSKDYREFCALQKRKGLKRSLWDELPRMWREEIEWRKQLEEAITS